MPKAVATAERFLPLSQLDSGLLSWISTALMSAVPSDGLGAAKTRRSHRKSRNGCFECKRRHIRCDEGQPACTNCSIAERVCSYPVKNKISEPNLRHQAKAPTLPLPVVPLIRKTPTLEPQAKPQAKPQVAQLAPSQLAPASQLAPSQLAPASQLAPSQLAPAKPPLWQPYPSQQMLSPAESSGSTAKPPHLLEPRPPSPKTSHQILPSFSHIDSRINEPSIFSSHLLFTHEHLALLHHAEHIMDGAIYAPNTTHHVVAIALKTAAQTPFVLDQLLALAAAHLTHHSPQSQISALRQQATELQTRALESYTNISQDITDEMQYCMERLLYIGMLSLQVHHDNFRDHASTFLTFINRFARSVEFYRGMLLTTPRQYGYIATQSDLAPCLATTRNARAVMIKGHECDILHRQLLEHNHDPTLTAEDRVAVAETIENLQASFDMGRAIVHLPDSHAPAASFSTLAPKGYVTMLRSLRPEALVMLAWHGVLLHRARTFWVYQDSGQWIIRAIAEYMGSKFAECLVFPLKVVEANS